MEGIKQFIAAEFTKIFIKCIRSYAEKYKTTHANIYILLVLDPQRNHGVSYRVVQRIAGIEGGVDTVKIVETIGILDLLGVKRLHFKGYDQIAPPYIRDALKNIAEQQGITEDEICVMVCSNDEEVFLFLYKWNRENEKICSNALMQLQDIEELF
jgi:hypothetical protein